MATSLHTFTTRELADVVGVTLGRGRPSNDLRASLIAQVADLRKQGVVRIKQGQLVRV